MNKEELIKIVSSETNFTKKDVSMIINSFLKEIVDSLDKGEEVRISDFGKFEIKEKKPRIGINPITKEALPIPGFKAISFHASETLKNKINQDKK